MTNTLRRKAVIVALLLISAVAANARDWSVKTNILYDATLTVNAGLERRLAPRWSVDLSGNLNAWTVNDHRWKHWMVQPEARYWFCEATAGHFVGVHALGGQYNVGNLDLGFKMLGTDFRNLRDRRYEGWYAGAGIAYGYTWIVNPRWSIEAEIGFGWIYTRYDAFPCAECGYKLASDKSHNYVGPTKAALNLVYVF